MAHELNEHNGMTSFASTKPAWHGLGQIVEKAMTSEEAIKLANLDYEVCKTPVMAVTDSLAGIKLLEGRFVTYRSDNNELFNVVGSRYEIVQNRDAFGFFDSIIGEKIAMFETARALRKGEKIFITAKMPEFIRIEGTDDLTEVYVLLTSSHDGSGAITAAITPVRVVCANTLNAALSQVVSKVHIKHTKNASEKLQTAHKLIGISHAFISEISDCFNYLAVKPITDDKVKELLKELFRSEQADSKWMEKIRQDAFGTYMNGVGQEKIVGSAWGFYNGVTNYLDHSKRYKNADAKFESIINGSSKLIADRALSLVVANY